MGGETANPLLQLELNPSLDGGVRRFAVVVTIQTDQTQEQKKNMASASHAQEAAAASASSPTVGSLVTIRAIPTRD